MPLEFESALPVLVDLKDEFPVPGYQGKQNSCVPWAVAYALKSHQETVKRDWGLHTDNHLFSPSYVYNQINHGLNDGTSYAFSGCKGITSVDIGNGMTTIGSYAFSYCTGLTGIDIGNNVTTIGDSAFYGCTELVSMDTGNNVTTIGDFAFQNCMALTSITLQTSVTYIGWSAFHYIEGFGEPNYVTLPELIIHCYENSYVHDYAIENKFPFILKNEEETKIIEVSPLANTQDITVNYIIATNTLDGFYNLNVNFEKAGEVFFILAVYEEDFMTKVYLADDNTEIKGITESDFTKGKIYIWDKNMQPCIEVIRILMLQYWN